MFSRLYPWWAPPPPTQPTWTSREPESLPPNPPALQRKGKSMLSLSNSCQSRQQHVNHSSQARVDWLGHWSEKSLQNSLLHDLSSHQVKEGAERPGWGNKGCKHKLIYVSLGRRLPGCVIPNPFREQVLLMCATDEKLSFTSSPPSTFQGMRSLLTPDVLELFTSHSQTPCPLHWSAY